MPPHPQRRRLGALTGALLLAAAACSEGGSPVVEGGAPTEAPATVTSTTAVADPLVILVSNDDGYAAPGIDLLVTSLAALPGVEVTVVAPDGNRSGAGGQTTPEGVTATDVATASGYPAVAVSGFPADAVAHALDTLGLQPDLVVSGANEGQNLGPLVDVSGTVGAARVAAQRGIPAVAVSAGFGPEVPDYRSAVDIAIQWVVEHRNDLEGATGDAVVNINVPTCIAGSVQGPVEVASAVDGGEREVLGAATDCTLAVAGTVPADDVDAFNTGFAAITSLAALPA